MKTIEVTPVKSGPEVVDVKHEAVDFKTASDKLRKEMAVVVFGAIANNLSDEDLKKYDGISDDINERYKAKIGETLKGMSQETETIDANSPEQDKVPEMLVGAPSGFPETREIEETVNELGPVTTSLRTRLMYAVNWPITAAYGKLFSMAEKRSAKLQILTDEQKEAHIASVGHRSTIAALGVGALYGAYMALTKTNFLDFAPSGSSAQPHDVYTTSHGDIKTMSVTQSATLEGSGGSGADHSQINRVRGPEEYPHLNKLGGNHEISSFAYNPAEDPALSAAKQGNNFGPALHMLPNDETMKWPGGMSDLVNDRWTNSPEEFATAMSKFGLVDNNSGAINQLAEQMKADPKLYHENYGKVMDIISRANVSEQAITSPYGSYYAVNMGGRDAVIAYDNYVNHGGTAIVIKVDGKEVWLRKECGGQCIDLKPAAAQLVYRPQGGSSHYYSQSAPAPRPVQPVPVPEAPVPTPVEPIPEPLPPVPNPEPLPPVLQPKDPREDINANPNLSEHKKMGDVRMGSGALQTEHEVKAPPSAYHGPEPQKDNTDTAPGARPSTSGGLHDRGQKEGQQSGLSTGAASGEHSGNTKGKVSK